MKGRNQKKNIVNEINLPEKSVISISELVNVFNEFFANVGPKLAKGEHNCCYRDFISQIEPTKRFLSYL